LLLEKAAEFGDRDLSTMARKKSTVGAGARYVDRGNLGRDFSIITDSYGVGRGEPGYRTLLIGPMRYFATFPRRDGRMERLNGADANQVEPSEAELSVWALAAARSLWSPDVPHERTVGTKA
jgi:hypothetical protein